MLLGRDAVTGFGTESQLGVRKDFRFRRMRSSLAGGHVDATMAGSENGRRNGGDGWRL
jgi:hypothetical protein